MKNLAKGTRAVEILLVEDNPGDVFLTKKCFEKAKLSNNITVATDGEIALKILKKEDEYSNCVTPDIILLDLNLPKISGKEVLEIVKKDEVLRRIPVVVLSSSNAEIDVISTYDSYANSYIVKPVDLNKFAKIVESIENFWFSIVVLPD